MIKDFICDYIKEEKDIFDNFPFDDFAQLVNLLEQAYEEESQIFVFGNGGSGSTASHFVGDMNKGVSFGLSKRFKMICLNDNLPTILAYGNDISFSDIFVEQLKNFMRPKDIVLGISGSGNSLNVIKAINYANKNQAYSVVLSGFDGGKIKEKADLCIIVPSSDMQKIEDFHFILLHMIMKFFKEMLNSKQ